MAVDYCTLSPDGSWRECCKEHDECYRRGDPKLESDIELWRCIHYNKKSPVVADVFFIGVTLFGWIPYLKHKYDRWVAEQETTCNED